MERASSSLPGAYVQRWSRRKSLRCPSRPGSPRQRRQPGHSFRGFPWSGRARALACPHVAQSGSSIATASGVLGLWTRVQAPSVPRARVEPCNTHHLSPKTAERPSGATAMERMFDVGDHVPPGPVYTLVCVRRKEGGPSVMLAAQRRVVRWNPQPLHAGRACALDAPLAWR